MEQSHSHLVRIERLVPGGHGLGYLDEGVVFVPLTAPGDLISLKDLKRRRGVGFAECDQIVESSAERRIPPCPWFGDCGGCQWMHLDYGSQLRWKENIFRQALRGIARLEEQSVTVHPAPGEFQYRFRARLQIRGAAVGFYRRASNRIVPWERCLQLPETINLAVEYLRAWFVKKKAPSGLRSCEIALSPVDGSMTFHWLFSAGKDSGKASRMIMDGVQDRGFFKDIDLVGQTARDDRGKVILARGGSLPLEAAGVRMAASPGTFFQVHPAVNAVLVERTLQYLRSLGTASLLDLYCGNGNLSLPAAAAGIRTVGVESSKQAVLDALSVSGPNSRFVAMDAFRFLSQDSHGFDAVIVDPPRAGLPREVIRSLGTRRFSELIYISCEPSTLARDIARLTGDGYRIKGMELFDMFPQTSHSETMILMKG